MACLSDPWRLTQTRRNPEGALTEVITLSGFSTRLVLQP
jgi:hypothetical protein